MRLLDFITAFETVQAIFAIGIAVAVVLLASGYAYRKSKLTDATLKERIDKVEEREHARRVEWHNVQHTPQIQGGTHRVDDSDET
jgi:hypothetical protein